ncbi:MAG: glycosyltransferase family 39 protein [Marmoricola sp.]|nr:glycosyltransferase family 39 protein [Marmoricola sp.]
MTDQRPAFARREVLLVAAGVGTLLLALSGRYGYHRDELYFLEAGKHLAWGYPDQPPLVPLLARLADSIAPGSLIVLRLPATLSAVAVVALTGLIARELGAARAAQVLAAIAAAVCGVVLATGHLLSTTTIALLGWVILTLVLVRALNGTATMRLWTFGGVVAGLTFQANPLVVALLVVFGLVTVALGPRALLTTPGPYAAAVIAVVIASPYVIWQAVHGLPQIDVARGISNGDSGTSSPRILFLPMQLLIVGPWLAPIWITGLVQLLRRPPLRALAATYIGLCVLFLVVGGKPYYLAGLYPLLLAAGAQPVLDRIHTRGAGALLVLSLPVIAVTLPVLPVQDTNPVINVNYDEGETIGWPGFVSQVADAYRSLPPGTAILTDNYGQAGAIDRYGADHDLPTAYSGHMAFAEWGPPRARTDSVLAIGIDPALLHRVFSTVEPVGELHNRWGIKNDENGTRLYACRGLTRPWNEVWPLFKHY